MPLPPANTHYLFNYRLVIDVFHHLNMAKGKGGKGAGVEERKEEERGRDKGGEKEIGKEKGRV